MLNIIDVIYFRAFSTNDEQQFATLLKDVFENMAQVLSLESDVVVNTQVMVYLLSCLLV